MSQYLVSVSHRSSAHVRMIFCPHAGGSSLGYLKFQEACPPGIDLFILDLPGRNRLHYDTWPEAWSELLPKVSLEVSEDLRPTIFLGHSFGAIVAFELARKFSESKKPIALGLSGINAPTEKRLKTRKKLSKIPDVEFEAEINQINGGAQALPPAFLKLIKADLSMLDAYSSPPKTLLPALAFGGSEDHLTTLEGLKDWEELVDLRACPRILNGRHLSYILENIQPIIEDLYQLLGSEKLDDSFR